MQDTTPGKPLFSHVKALKTAAEMLGFEVINTNVYNWYGRVVGDYPMPAGMKQEDLGKNAKFVLRHKDGNGYDIGIIEDPNNPGCYVPIYDFWEGGGLGKYVGDPIETEDGLKLCPKLVMRYNMCCEMFGAKDAGDSIEFLTMKQAHKKYPHMIPPSDDDETYVSLAKTEQRLGV